MNYYSLLPGLRTFEASICLRHSAFQRTRHFSSTWSRSAKTWQLAKIFHVIPSAVNWGGFLQRSPSSDRGAVTFSSTERLKEDFILGFSVAPLAVSLVLLFTLSVLNETPNEGYVSYLSEKDLERVVGASKRPLEKVMEGTLKDLEEVIEKNEGRDGITEEDRDRFMKTINLLFLQISLWCLKFYNRNQEVKDALGEPLMFCMKEKNAFALLLPPDSSTHFLGKLRFEIIGSLGKKGIVTVEATEDNANKKLNVNLNVAFAGPPQN